MDFENGKKMKKLDSAMASNRFISSLGVRSLPKSPKFLWRYFRDLFVRALFLGEKWIFEATVLRTNVDSHDS